jgi:dolichol-phosphate hexosyltransferase
MAGNCKMTRSTVKLLVPTLNEARNIGTFLDRVKQNHLVGEVVIIDGHSTDGTLDIVKEYDVTLLMQKGKGKGNAIIEALAAFQPDDRVIMIDGDMSYDPLDVRQFVPFISNGVLVNGSRFSGTIKKGAMPTKNFIGNKILSFIASLACRNRVTDLLSGMKGFIISDMRRLELKSQNFDIETEIILKYSRHFHIREVPISYQARGGASKLRPLRDGTAILSKIISLL